MDLLMLSGADDEDCVPDKAEDVRPVFAHSRRKDNEVVSGVEGVCLIG